MWEQLGLQHLRALDAILETGSVTRAAAGLGLSQSALSHQLARLREVLDDPLVVRGAKGMVPTPRALALAAPLRRALVELELALTTGASWAPATSTRLFRLALPDAYATAVLPTILERVAQEAPGVDIDVRPLIGAPFVEALERGEIDLTGGATTLSSSNVLRWRAALKEDFASVVRLNHPEVGESLDLDTFCALNHVLISPDGGRGGIVDEALAALGRRRRVQLTIRYFLAAPLIVAASDLILTGPRSVLRYVCQRAPLRLVETPLELPGFQLGLFWHQRVQEDPGHRWLRDVVASAFRTTDLESG